MKHIATSILEEMLFLVFLKYIRFNIESIIKSDHCKFFEVTRTCDSMCPRQQQKQRLISK